MSRGSKEYTDKDGTTHHTDYNDTGRHSYNYDDGGNITKDHATYKDNQDYHYNSPDHNMNDVSWTPEDQYNEFNGIMQDFQSVDF